MTVAAVFIMQRATAKPLFTNADRDGPTMETGHLFERCLTRFYRFYMG